MPNIALVPAASYRERIEQAILGHDASDAAKRVTIAGAAYSGIPARPT